MKINYKTLSLTTKFYAIYSAVQAKQKTFTVATTITIIFSVFSTLVSGATSILIARILGPQQLGQLVLFMTGSLTVALFADVLGIYYSNAYLLASNTHHFDVRVVRGTVLTYGIIVGLVVGSMFGLITPIRLLIFQDLNDWSWRMLISINILGLVLFNQIRGLFLGDSNFFILGALAFFQAVIYFLLAVTITHVLSYQTGIYVATTYVITIWICISSTLGILRFQGIASPSLKYIKACNRVGWRAAITNWLGFLQLRSDQYLVNWLLGSTALGFYAVAVTWSELLTRIPGVMGSVLFPLVAAEKNKCTMAHNTLKRCGIVMLVAFLISIPLFIHAETLIVFFYGNDFGLSIQSLQFLLPATVFMSGLLIVDNHLAGLGYPPAKTTALLISLFINILGNVFLLPKLGVIGASLASSFSYLVWLLIVIGYLWFTSAEPQPKYNCLLGWLKNLNVYKQSSKL